MIISASVTTKYDYISFCHTIQVAHLPQFQTRGRQSYAIPTFFPLAHHYHLILNRLTVFLQIFRFGHARIELSAGARMKGA